MDSKKGKDVTIRTQKPVDAGYIDYRHCVLYEKKYGLGRTFRRLQRCSYRTFYEIFLRELTEYIKLIKNMLQFRFHGFSTL